MKALAHTHSGSYASAKGQASLVLPRVIVWLTAGADASVAIAPRRGGLRALGLEVDASRLRSVPNAWIEPAPSQAELERWDKELVTLTTPRRETERSLDGGRGPW